ncbi:hypothetical protein CCZ01_01370 [Helicobacter monodelphidis]|uniref:hypothetical protein n=1 Tax=Helicobacter sp. 15-1451 TaxID=2004995 RepID=UPI000DCCA4B6|nr:hypothetical protein [Helicobacter sp. 15-1451]RAX58873.1 hypothetical protein CCZ01_01370 [Helicobacter sp. 15-1451]
MNFWRYGNSLYLFFFTLIAISLVFVFLMIQNRSQNSTVANSYLPLELIKFTYYQINGEEGVKLKAEGTHAYQTTENNQTTEFIRDLSLIQDIDHHKSSLMTSFAIRKGDQIFFDEGVYFSRDDSLFFWSQKGTYFIESRVFNGEGDFFMNDTSGSTMQGKNIFYDYYSSISIAQAIRILAERK